MRNQPFFHLLANLRGYFWVLQESGSGGTESTQTSNCSTCFQVTPMSMHEVKVITNYWNIAVQWDSPVSVAWGRGFTVPVDYYKLAQLVGRVQWPIIESQIFTLRTLTKVPLHWVILNGYKSSIRSWCSVELALEENKERKKENAIFVSQWFCMQAIVCWCTNRCPCWSVRIIPT